MLLVPQTAAAAWGVFVSCFVLWLARSFLGFAVVLRLHVCVGFLFILLVFV